MKIIFFIFVAVITATQQIEQSDIALIVLSQENKYNNDLAEELKLYVEEQAESLYQESPKIYFTHRHFPHIGDWTILPIIPNILNLHSKNTKWIVFCQDVTRFHLAKLYEMLAEYDHEKDIWLGHALHDKEATIIHHFAFFEDPTSFIYPNFASGFIFSIPLLQQISSKLEEFYKNDIEFSIDASHELSSFILKNIGVKLTDEPRLCVNQEPKCASYVKKFESCADVQADNIFYAVKTCKKFRYDRMPIIEKTWGKNAKTVNYFSDQSDSVIPMTELKIPNTETGHCEKTVEIVRLVAHIFKENSKFSWLAIVDDDTIISPSRLSRYLTCFDPTKPLLIGERYGYRAYLGEKIGYNYVTGGGGMILSRHLTLLLADSFACTCPTPNSPDDMCLGVCTVKAGGIIVHSPGFHQARPSDYAEDYLASYEAISFHKHWMIDPYKVYVEWFMQDDVSMFKNESHAKKNYHTEL